MQAMNVQRTNFDEFASEYHNIHNRNLRWSGTGRDHFAEWKVKIIRELLKDKPITSMLDFGCGDGNSALFFNVYFPNINYHGIDVSKDSIAIAQKKIFGNFDFRWFDGHQIPFDKNTFHLVFMACVLHHVRFSDHIGVINDCKRVLKQGGWLIIFEHNPFNPLTLKIVRECVFDRDAMLLYPNYLKNNLITVCFNRVKLKFTIFFPRHKIFRPLLKFEKYLEPIPFGGQYYTIAQKGADTQDKNGNS